MSANGSDTWTNGSGDWFSATNWSAGLPGATATAVLAPAAPATIRFDGGATLAGLEGSATATLSIAGGTLTLLGLAPATLAGALDFAAGSIDLAAGALALSGGGTLAGGLLGSGTLRLDGNALYTLAAGLTLGTVGLDLTGSARASLSADLADAGAFTMGTLPADAPTLDLGGHTLSLSGSATFRGGTVEGPGTLALAGGASAAVAALTLAGGATLADSAWAHQDGTLALGTSATDTAGLTIAPGATYSIFQSQITAAGAGDRIVNAGTFGIVAGVDQSSVGAAITSTGTVEVDSGTLGFYGGGTFAGTGPSASAAITGHGQIGLFGGTTTFGPYLALSVASLAIADAGTSLVLGAGERFSGTFQLGAGTRLETGLHALTLSGAATLHGDLLGAGVLDITGSAGLAAAALSGGTTLRDGGLLTQSGTLWIGGSARFAAQLEIAAGARYAITNDSAIRGGTLFSGRIDNAGTLEKTGGSGTSLVAPATVNDATIAAFGGTLAFADLLNNATLEAAGGTLALASTLSAAAGHAGRVEIGAGGTLALAAGADASQSIAFTAPGATLLLDGPDSVPAGTISGFASGDIIHLAGVTATGLLTVATGADATDVTVFAAGTAVMTLHFLSPAAALASLSVAADPAGGSDLLLAPASGSPPLAWAASLAQPTFAANAPAAGPVEARAHPLAGALPLWPAAPPSAPLLLHPGG